MTKIEWAQDTRNWQAGCTEARRADGSMDPACVHCYARLQSARMPDLMCDGSSARDRVRRLYEGVAERRGRGAVWTGRLQWDPALVGGLAPGRVTFVGSMTDLWHEDADPAAWIALATWARTVDEGPADRRPRGMVTLTKRAGRLLAFQREHFPAGLPSWWWPGVTVADQLGADERTEALLDLRADGPKVVSYEPAMGPVSWAPFVRGLGWLIAGGESGHGARPSHPDWFRAARDAATTAGVPFFFKQWGEWGPSPSAVAEGDHAFPDGLHMTRVGKRAAGRLLDGRTWDEVPS